MFIAEHSEVRGEVGSAVIIWGVPALLVITAGWRYRHLDPVPSPLRIAIWSLFVSEAMLLLIGAVVFVESTTTARVPFFLKLQTIGLVNFLLCAVALLTSLVTKIQDTVRVWITVASAYLMFVWLYAMMAH